MTGIGEAAAIIAVAQLRIKLSKSLSAYVDEVKDAPARVQCVSNEVQNTSERLNDVGELMAKNPQTKFFNSRGVRSAKRCSDQCNKVIGQVRQLLQMSGRVPQSQVVEKDEIDITLFSSFRWPFIKTKLDVARTELHRIKADLNLLCTMAMALGASTVEDQQKYKQDIPGLQKRRKWAAEKAEIAKRRAQDPQPESSAYRDGSRQRRADEAEMWRRFVEFEEKQQRETEEFRLKERAALLEAEQKQKKADEEEAHRKLQEKAVADFVKKQDDLRVHNEMRKENLRKKLATLPVGLHADQINAVVEKMNSSGDKVYPQPDSLANMTAK